MIAFFIISSICTPPLFWAYVYIHILPREGWSQARERLDLVKGTLKNKYTYLWAVWTLLWILVTIFIGF